MQTTQTLLQADFNGRLFPQPDLSLGNPSSIERALFRARGALADGWQLTAEEALSLFGHEAETCEPPPTSEEDEIEEIADYFGHEAD